MPTANRSSAPSPGGRRLHPGGGSRHPLAAAFALVAGACGGDGATSDHPIDRVLAPRLAELGLAAREPEPYEHCRRIAIDLLGGGPRPEALDSCAAARPDRRVDLAQNHPDYVRAARRFWSEVLGYDALEVWSRDLADLDSLVVDLAIGRLDYVDFAAEVVVHPGFVALHPEDDWARAVYQVFLGRVARDDEVAALRPLTAPWQARYVCEGSIWWNFYRGYLDDGAGEEEAIELADVDCADAARLNFGLNLCLCSPDDGLLGCHSSALGRPVALPAECGDPDDPYAARNLALVGKSAPGGDDTCPDGSRRDRCADREVDEDFATLSPPVNWRPLGEDARADLRAIGAALAARPDFWEAAADRMLRRLTGWWQASFRHPDTDLPEVRALLAGRLQGGSSLREVEKLIATSQLYAAPATPPPGWHGPGEAPPWSMGPTKLLAAEAWLDTLFLALGERPGSCDVRAVTLDGYDEELTDPRAVEDPTSSLDAVQDDYYIEAATALGGCRAGTPRPTQSSVGLAFLQGEHARFACTYAREAAPSGDRRDGGAHLVRRLFARPADDRELDELAAEMDACLDAGARGEAACADPDAALRWLCQRLADSTSFATY